MGPRSIDRGNVLLSHGHSTTTLLQWGRGRSTAEMSASMAVLPGIEYASMGPRSIDRGKSQTGLRRSAPTQSFNGAAVDRPRKVAARTVSLALRCGASMGPRSIDRGKCLSAAVNAGALSGFNGAAVDRPRKGDAPWLERGRCLDRFNGAAVDRPRKVRSDPCQHSSLDPSLQWGRGRSTAESWRGGTCQLEAWQASMGPRSIDRGKQTLAVDADRDSGRFNGAAVDRPRKEPDGTSVIG